MTYKVTHIPKDMDIVIATVPSIELRPPIGPARIKAYLNTVNLKCYNIDLNLDLWHRLKKDKEFFQSDEDRFWEGSDKWQLWQDKIMFDDFFVRALVAGIGVAIVTGPLGCFVIWRRLAYFGDTLSHSALLGVTLAFSFSINISLSVFFVSGIIALLLLSLQKYSKSGYIEAGKN